MERSIIKDADVTGSAPLDFFWHRARLFNVANGLCVSQSTSDLHLKINFANLITVNAVAMQGDIATHIFNRLTYQLLADNGTSTFKARGTVSISSSIYCFSCI